MVSNTIKTTISGYHSNLMLFITGYDV